ncbi:MAG TPA: NusA N-terminal domain-containing protein, partial [Actinomycetota bacterium]|nr:NusA N-terminal domain-containing protein [Actinomycetota bacterium]
MSAELVQALRELEREKGISFETILRGLEEALASAYKSHIQAGEEEENELEDVRVSLDPESGDMRAWLRQLDEEGNVTSEKEIELTAEFKGRMSPLSGSRLTRTSSSSFSSSSPAW